MMNNVTDYFWDISQVTFDNKSLYNASASASPPISGTAASAEEDAAIFYVDLSFRNGSLDAALRNATEPTFMGCINALQRNQIGLFVFLSLFSVSTVFGNSLVILAVFRERYLHTSTNLFVTSLAVADCLVGLVVMPFSAMYEVFDNTWFFGTDWCDIWRSLDVLFSTASILNLCVISLDRYWAITDPFSYPMRMTRKKAATLIGLVWICSGAISFPAIMWWRAARDSEMPAFKCIFTEHLGYLVFSSTISFYLPLLVMVFTYCRIYRAAVIQTRSLKMGTKQVMMASGELQLTLRIHRGGTTREGPNRQRRINRKHQDQQQQQQQQQLFEHEHLQLQPDNMQPSNSSATANSTPEEPEEEPLSGDLHNNGLSSARHRHMGKNFSLSRKLAKFAKEKKAAKTLGIVMGVFIICWLPFFVVNLLSGFCMQCIAHEEIISAVVTWLGWINSSMNPVIYACWSRDFRRAFVRILCTCCPRKIRRKYQPTMRSKSQRFASRRCYSTCSLHGIQQAYPNPETIQRRLQSDAIGFHHVAQNQRPKRYGQCKVAAAMVAASTSVNYSSVNQYDGPAKTPSNRSIMGRRHLNSCSSCDSCSKHICASASAPPTNGHSSCAPLSSTAAAAADHHHFHHTRRPAMRQQKRCTYATSVQTTMSVANKNGGPPTTTIVNLPLAHGSSPAIGRLVPQASHSFYHRGGSAATTGGGSAASAASAATQTTPSATHHIHSEYRLPRTMIESSSAAGLSPIVVVVAAHQPAMYPLPKTIVQSASCLSISSSSSDLSTVSASIQVND